MIEGSADANLGLCSISATFPLAGLGGLTQQPGCPCKAGRAWLQGHRHTLLRYHLMGISGDGFTEPSLSIETPCLSLEILMRFIENLLSYPLPPQTLTVIISHLLISVCIVIPLNFFYLFAPPNVLPHLVIQVTLFSAEGQLAGVPASKIHNQPWSSTQVFSSFRSSLENNFGTHSERGCFYMPVFVC